MHDVSEYVALIIMVAVEVGTMLEEVPEDDDDDEEVLAKAGSIVVPAALQIDTK